MSKAWILLAVAMAASRAVAEETTPVHSERTQDSNVSPAIPVDRYRSSSWLIHRTSNFRVCTREIEADHSELAKRCELLRSRLQLAWFGDETEASWSPRCDIIVHASIRSYQRALGHGVGRSVGCATLKFDGGRVVSRQIDVRIDADNWSADALPHELTHIVLADHFADKRLPRWADEGMGVLAESTVKQSKRFNALKESATRGSVYRATALLQLTHFPRAGLRDAFYGQSATIVGSLVQRESPKHFLDFINVAIKSGYEYALRQVYGIEHVDQLTRLSLRPASDPSPIWKRNQTDRRAKLAERVNR